MNNQPEIKQKIKSAVSSISSFNTILSSTYYKFCKTESLLADFYTPLSEAVTTIEARRTQTNLQSAVQQYVENDIPDHLNQDTPVFYLSRFMATPNYETYHVHKMVGEYEYPLVIGVDYKSKFVSHNELKLALAKLPVVQSISKHGDDIVEYFTLTDFAEYNGKPFDTIYTNAGTPLVNVHKNLFNYSQLPITVGDETRWVDKHHRCDIHEQYKQLLAILCTHGIMLESFTPSEYDFFREIVYPAFKTVEADLGVRPLIVEHITPTEEATCNWNAYPPHMYDYIKSIV